MLTRTPALARHVQKLTVRPEYDGKRKQPEFIRAWNHAHIVSSLVASASKHMDALHTFSWDGEDTLPDDVMWADLRKWCVFFTLFAYRASHSHVKFTLGLFDCPFTDAGART